MGEENMLMVEKKTIFNASFEESKNIQGKYKKYIKNSYKQMGIWNIILTAFLAIMFFGIISYALGVGMLEGFLAAKPNEINRLDYHNVILAARIAFPFIVISKIFVFLWVFVWGIIIIRRILPKWTVVSFAILGGLAGAVMSLLLLSVLGPILFGFALIGVGWLGVIFQVILFITLGINQLKNELGLIYQRIYYPKKDSGRKSKKYFIDKKILIMIFVAMTVNMCTFRVGAISKNFELISLVYSWLFLLLGVFTIYLVKFLIIRNGISSYYFRKYKEQYRKNWNLTDEQWYGKRKAQKIAKKK
jgi:hypothetical protein